MFFWFLFCLPPFGQRAKGSSLFFLTWRLRKKTQRTNSSNSGFFMFIALKKM